MRTYLIGKKFLGFISHLYLQGQLRGNSFYQKILAESFPSSFINLEICPLEFQKFQEIDRACTCSGHILLSFMIHNEKLPVQKLK